jgi:hypothetical protein
MNKSGLTKDLQKNRSHLPWDVQGRVLLKPMKVILVMKRRVPAILHQGKVGLSVRRRRKIAEVKILSLMEKTYTWKQWKICGSRERRPKS